MEALEQLQLTNIALIPLFKDTCAEIYHIAAGNVIYMKMRGLTKNQCYQANAERLITAFTRFKSAKLFMDFSDLMMMNTEDRCWTEEVWQEQASKAGLKNMAIIMPNNLFAALSINKMVENIKQNMYWQSETFTNEDQAYHWLIK